MQGLRELRRRIYKEFYTTGQMLRLARKGTHNGALRFLPGLLLRLPGIAWRVHVARRERALRRAERALSRTL